MAGKIILNCRDCEQTTGRMECRSILTLLCCSSAEAEFGVFERNGMSSWIPSEIRWLSRQVRPFLRWHAAGLVCISIGSLLGLLAPLVLKSLIDLVLPSHRIGLLIGTVGLIFLCHQGRAVLRSVGGYLTMRAAERLALDMRLRLLRHLDTLSADYHERTPVGASMYPLQEPIHEISYFGSDLLPSVLRTLMGTMLSLGTMLLLNARMTLAVLLLISRLSSDQRAFP
jgi:ABC-type bacteriocin/lantibiotic exporter with double-glycine peptidase domain